MNLSRMLDADVLRVAQVFIDIAEQAPASDPRSRKNERDRIRRALKKMLPDTDVSGMLPPTEKTGPKNRWAHLEWELTELFQYAGLIPHDAAACAVTMMRDAGLIRFNQRPIIEGYIGRRPSSLPVRERKFRKTQKEAFEAQDAFVAASKSGDETAAKTAFQKMNTAWEKYLALRKLAVPHVANSIKMLEVLRGKRPEVAANLLKRLRTKTK